MKWVAGAVAGLPVVGGLFIDARAEQARTEDLFVAVDAAAMTRPQKSDAGVLRERSVRVYASLLDIARLAAGRSATPTLLRAQLFEDVAFRAVVDQTGPTSAGYWLSGPVTEPAPGEFALVVNGRTIAGTVRTHSGDLYKIRTEDTGNTFVRGIDASTSLPRELSLRHWLGRTRGGHGDARARRQRHPGRSVRQDDGPFDGLRDLRLHLARDRRVCLRARIRAHSGPLS